MNNRTLTNSLIFLTSLASIFIVMEIFPTIKSILHYIYEILLPFLVAFLLTFIMLPIVDKLERRKIHRGVAVFIVFSSAAYVLIYLIVSITPMVMGQLDEIIGNIPKLINGMDVFLEDVIERFYPDGEVTTETIADYIINNILTINGLLKGFLVIVYESLGIIFLTPIITFYLLYDYHNIKRRLRIFLEKRNKDLCSDFLEDLEKLVGDYFRGLIIVMFIMSIVSSTIFSFIGLEYPILFGIVIAITNIVPIIGPYIGGGFAAIYAMTQSIPILIGVIVSVVIIQFLESNILTPYIQSRTLKVHPLFILVAFLVFGSMFGFVGMILSIPLLGVLMLLIKYYKIYRKRLSLISVSRPLK